MKPTRVRLLIVIAAAFAAVVLYLDRVCLAFVERPVTIDLHLNDGEFKWVMSAFFFTYALFQVPAGFLSDRYGGRRMLTLYLLACVLCTVGISLAGSFLFLLITRLALGIAEAGAYPTCAGLLRRWVPVRNRGVASSCVALGGRLGGATTPFITALLLVAFLPTNKSALLGDSDILVTPAELQEKIDHLDETAEWAKPGLARLDVYDINATIRDDAWRSGWVIPQDRLPRTVQGDLNRPLTEAESQRLNRLILEAALPKAFRPYYGTAWRTVFLAFAGFGFLVALAFWLVVRDSPAQHPWANEAEAALVPIAATTSHDPPAKVLSLLVQSRNLWLSSGAQFSVNIAWAFLITKLPSFLEEVYRSPIEVRGLQSSVPLFMGAFGMLFGGILTDRLARRYGLRWGRSLPMGLMQFLGACAFLSVPLLGSAWPVVIAFAVAAFATDTTNPAVWSLMQDITPRHVGTAMGWANMWGNFGAALSPLLLAWIQQAWGWDAVFISCGIAYVGAGIAGLFINATVPLDPTTVTPRETA